MESRRKIARNVFVFLLIMTSILGGCAVKRQKMPPLAFVDGVPRHFFIGQIIRVETGDLLSFWELIDQLASKNMIFIGEVHDNPEHHLIQVQILQALFAQNVSNTVAMEFFQKSQQPHIDRYMTGKSSEKEFLDDVDWKNQWSFDYSFYRPLMLAVKEKGGKILAINAPNDIVKKVARSGLGSLDPDERVLLAKSIDLKNEKHRDYLKEIFEYNPHGVLKNFDFFYEAQCVWEDTMAENISEFFKKTNETMIILTGNGHIVNKFGIPDRTLGRVPVDMATVMLLPMENGKLTIDRQTADYIWLTGKYPQRHSFYHKIHHPDR